MVTLQSVTTTEKGNGMAAIGVSSQASFGFVDHSGEHTRTKLHFAPLDGSADNSGLLAFPTGSIDLIAIAMALLTKLPSTGVTLSVRLGTSAPALPADATAQRELACRVIYADTVTGKKYRFDLPAPIDALVPSGTDQVDIGTTDFDAFRLVFEAEVLSEVGNPVVVLSARIVGRND
jgi:hypothetical protein